MPRIGMKALLALFVLLALWFSTFSGYSAGRDVRASVLLVVVLASGFVAVYSHCRRRAFWAGFFVVMLLFGGNPFQGPLNQYVPNFAWLQWNFTPNTYPTPSGGAIYSVPQSTRYSVPGASASDYMIETEVEAPPRTSFAMLNPVPFEHAAATDATVEAAWALSLATIVGLIAVFIYDQRQRPDQQSDVPMSESID